MPSALICLEADPILSGDGFIMLTPETELPIFHLLSVSLEMAAYNTSPFNLFTCQFPSSAGVNATNLMCSGS